MFSEISEKPQEHIITPFAIDVTGSGELYWGSSRLHKEDKIKNQSYISKSDNSK